MTVAVAVGLDAVQEPPPQAMLLPATARSNDTLDCGEVSLIVRSVRDSSKPSSMPPAMAAGRSTEVTVVVPTMTACAPLEVWLVPCMPTVWPGMRAWKEVKGTTVRSAGGMPLLLPPWPQAPAAATMQRAAVNRNARSPKIMSQPEELAGRLYFA